MLTIAYSGKSKPSAEAIAVAADEMDETIEATRSSSSRVDINWGRSSANATLNADISNSTNKRVMREKFQEAGVPMPKLLNAEEVKAAIADEQIIIGRPDHHSKKRGFWLIENEASLRKALLGTRRKKAATHFMEYVEHDREYRVHIFNGKSIRISEKEFHEDGTYTTKKPGDIKLRRVRDAAKAAVEAVGLDFGAVDILARGTDNDEVFVLEVNAAPGLGGSMPKLYAETFRRWKEEQEE